MPSLEEIISELTIKTQESKIGWRTTGHTHHLRANFGESRVTVAYDNWDETEHFTVELRHPEDQVIESSRSYELDGAHSLLFRSASEAALGLSAKRHELWETIQSL